MTHTGTGGPPSTDDTAAPVLSVDEAARLLGGLDRKTIYGAIARGELPALRLGRRILISRAVLDRMLSGEQP